MNENTGIWGKRPSHIDTLRVVYGHALPLYPVHTIPLGQRAVAEPIDTSAHFPAGRGA